jgi:hypothetical protein
VGTSVGGDHLEAEHTVRVWAGRVLMLVLAGILLWAGLFLIGPSWTAHMGAGTPGTFTATRRSCSGGCQWYGTFVPTGDGTPRYDVRMGYGHNGIQAIGDVVPAIDAGAPNVFPADGGYDWLLSIASLGLGGVVLVLWVIRLLRHRRPSTLPRS